MLLTIGRKIRRLSTSFPSSRLRILTTSRRGDILRIPKVRRDAVQGVSHIDEVPANVDKGEAVATAANSPTASPLSTLAGTSSI
jgi:hypothetical protein